MASRQTIWIREHRAAGLCVRCSQGTWMSGYCFRHYVSRQFSRLRILNEAKRHPRSWNAFLTGMQARYTRIVTDEGFAVDAVKEPERLIALAGMKWAKYKKKKKVLSVIARLDDTAIREMLRGSRTGGEK